MALPLCWRAAYPGFVANVNDRCARNKAVLEGKFPLRTAAFGAPSIGSLSLGGPAIHAPISITVEGGSRGPEADTELANRIGRQLRDTVRAEIGGELRKQMRPGGLLSP
jgi:hypothetical protein